MDSHCLRGLGSHSLRWWISLVVNTYIDGDGAVVNGWMEALCMEYYTILLYATLLYATLLYTILLYTILFMCHRTYRLHCQTTYSSLCTESSLSRMSESGFPQASGIRRAQCPACSWDPYPLLFIGWSSSLQPYPLLPRQGVAYRTYDPLSETIPSYR